jgi:hypothetical protein
MLEDLQALEIDNGGTLAIPGQSTEEVENEDLDAWDDESGPMSEDSDPDKLEIEESEFGDSEEWEEWDSEGEVSEVGDYDVEDSETSILEEAEHEIRD